MNNSFQIPKVKTLGCLWMEDRLLVEECTGAHSKGEGFYYRPLGGTVEFGEPSDETLKREFLEEIGEQVEIVSYIGCIENIFTIKAETGHEVIQMYDVRFVDQHNYSHERFLVQEGEKQAWARWIELSEFVEGEKYLYPAKLVSILERRRGRI
ncbi:8-oxo-dGTP pyrophosphatase MutT (NUDIX family) [Sporosarcina luteola]|nr:8-oxo-dGTP pyrophosphatase MutT (NUDIX family) [Sporosarcina luteola]